MTWKKGRLAAPATLWLYQWLSLAPFHKDPSANFGISSRGFGLQDAVSPECLKMARGGRKPNFRSHRVS